MDYADNVRSRRAALIYLMVLPVPCFPLADGSFAVEGAFCQHLRQLQEMIAGRFDELRLVTPVMSQTSYESGKGRWSILSKRIDRISHSALHERSISPVSYWLRHLVPNLIKLNREIRSADLVHAGPSNHYYPFEFFALMIAAARRKPTIFVVDIDTRRSAKMNYTAKRWSLKSYLLARYIYDPLKSLQIWLAARTCSLVLLKGQKLCDDFGSGRSNVRNFIDAAFSGDHIISSEKLENKIASLHDTKRPLEIVYFGRLVPYKGIDQSIESIAKAAAGADSVLRFHVIGAGPVLPELQDLVIRLNAGTYVSFEDPIPFGPKLFARLQDCDLLLATPQSEDTPRSALDAMASGVPVLAFNTYYYEDLKRSGAVEVVPWNSIDQLAQKIEAFAADKTLLEIPARNAVRFASENTQELWLRRRFDWTVNLIGDA